MAVLKNRAKMSTSATGTGSPITLGSAEDGYQTFADAGVADADVVRYVIEDGSNWEIGTGTYTASGTTLTRTVSESSNSDAAINLSGSATVFIGATAEDIPALYAANEVSVTAQPSATGDDAIAIGDSAVASGVDAVAIGNGATVGGSYSFAGFGSANGNYSVALGLLTTANSERSVAIGNGASTTGTRTTAIGYNSGASNTGAVAFTNSRASGTDSFAAVIANNTSSYGATGSNSIAMGDRSKATGSRGVAIGGYNAIASGTSSMATGYQAEASTTYAHAHGYQAEASGQRSWASTRSVASGNDSWAAAINDTTTTYGSQHAYSVALGYQAVTTADYQIALGSSTAQVKVSGAYTLPTSDGTNGQVLTTDGSGAVTFADAGGGGGASEYTIDNKTAAYTVVSGDLGKILNYTSGTVDVTLTALSSLTTGFYVSIWNSGTGVISIKPNSVDGIGVSAGNDYDSSDPLKLEMGTGVTLVNSGTYWQIYSEKAYDYYHHSVTLGANAKASNNYAMALGNRSTASSVGAIAIGTGQGHATTASNSHAVAIGLSTASGANSTALGTSNASGSHSLAAAIANNTSSYGANATSSIAMGYQAKATGSYSEAIGFQAISSNTHSVAIGRGTNSSGVNGSVALGYYADADGESSIALGQRAKSRMYGELAFASDSITGNNGDSQTAIRVLISSTTDATPEALTTSNTTAGTTNQIILPNNSAYSFSGTIIARESAAAGSDYASWEIKGALLRDANAASTVLGNGIQNKLYATSGASAWAIALSADTTNGGLKIEVTGAASTNIRWVATVHTSEVTYA